MFCLRFAFTYFFLLFLIPNYFYAAVVVREALEPQLIGLLDTPARAALWSKIPAPQASTASPNGKSLQSRSARRRAKRRQAKASQSGAPGVSREPRRFSADFAHKPYMFKVYDNGELRVVGPTQAKVLQDAQGIVRVNLDDPAFQEARKLVENYLSKEKLTQRVEALRKQEKLTHQFSPSQAPKAPRVSPSPRSSRSLSASRRKTSPVGSRGRGGDSAAAGAPGARAVTGNSNEGLAAAKVWGNDDLQGAIHEMLDDGERLMLSATSRRHRAALTAQQHAAGKTTAAAYDALISAQKSKKPHERHLQRLQELINAVESNFKHYDAMSKKEQQSLFYIANHLQHHGNAERAFELLTSRGVSLEKLKSYGKKRAELLLRTAFRAKKYAEISYDATKVNFNELFGNSSLQMLGMPARVVGGLRLSARSYFELLSVKALSRYEDELLLELFALSGGQLFKVDGMPNTFARIISGIAERGSIDRFFDSKTIPPKSKAILAARMEQLGFGTHEQIERGLSYASKLEKSDPDFPIVAIAIATSHVGQDSKALDAIYDALYTGRSSEQTRKSIIKAISDPGQTRPSDVMTRLVRPEGAAGGAGRAGGEVVLSPKAKLLKHLRLAEDALDKSRLDDTGKEAKEAYYQAILEHAEAVLASTDPPGAKQPLLLPGAKQRAHELQVLTLSHQFGSALESKVTGRIEEAYTKWAAALSEADKARVRLPFDVQASVAKQRAAFAHVQRRGNDAVMHLWEMARLKSFWMYNQGSGRLTDKAQVPKLMEKLSNDADALGIDTAHRQYLEGLSKYYKGASGALDLSKVPTEYHADALYQHKIRSVYKEYKVVNIDIPGLERSADNLGLYDILEETLALNPHPFLRDLVYAHLGAYFDDLVPGKGFRYSDLAANSEWFEQDGMRAKLVGDSVTIQAYESVTPQQRERALRRVYNARFDGRGQIAKLAADTHMFTYPETIVGAIRRYGSNIDQIPRPEREILLTALHGVIEYPHLRESMKLTEDELKLTNIHLRKRRAEVIRTMLGEMHRSYNPRASEVSAVPNEAVGAKLLKDIAAEDEAFVRANAAAQ